MTPTRRSQEACWGSWRHTPSRCWAAYAAVDLWWESTAHSTNSTMVLVMLESTVRVIGTWVGRPGSSNR